MFHFLKFESLDSMKFSKSIGDIHFIGIGGIGMSGIAEILHRLGYQVRGSSDQENSNTRRLKDMGVTVQIGHDPEIVRGAAVVVTSTAIQPSNVELLAAIEMKIPVIPRAEMLGELMRLRPSIAVSGTHGKTTTTSLVASLLEEASMDPTVVNGGIINAYGTNARLGQGQWIVVEADESDGSFNKLFPTLAIVTNIDEDHMDFFKSLDEIQGAFENFVEKIPFYGLAVLCGDHPNVLKLSKKITDRRVVTYGLREGVDVQGLNLTYSAQGSHFDVKSPWGEIKDITVSMVGEHNVLNALSAITIALHLGIQPDVIRSALLKFQGVQRRFTLRGVVNGVSIIDDYGHHPVEIKAVLKSARSLTQGKVIAVVQPHRYSRLKALFEEFKTCFEDADHVIVTPVYSAGEEPIPGMEGSNLAEALQAKGTFINDPAELTEIIAKLTNSGDYVVCLGAGSITQWAKELPQHLNTFHSNSNGRAA